jgi:hypothetical protein
VDDEPCCHGDEDLALVSSPCVCPKAPPLLRSELAGDAIALGRPPTRNLRHRCVMADLAVPIRRQPRRVSAFWAGVGSLLALQCGSASSAALLLTYQERLGVSDTQLTIAFCMYMSCATLGFLVAARYAWILGTRLASVVALTCGTAGCLVLTQVADVSLFALGRGLQGLATGFGLIVMSEHVLRHQAAGRSKLGPVMIAWAASTGVAMGALGSGWLTTTVGNTFIAYLVAAALMVACAVWIGSADAGLDHEAGSPSTPHRLRVSKGARGALVATCVAYGGGWVLAALYQSVGPTVAGHYLGFSTPVVGALVTVMVIVAAAVGAPALAWMSARGSIYVGSVLLAIGAVSASWGLVSGSAVVFIGAALLAGFGMGSANQGAMRLLLGAVSPAESAPAITILYITTFASGGVSALLVGTALSVLPMSAVLVLYGVYIAIVGAVSVVLVRKLT